MYRVVATVTIKDAPWTKTRQIPTFELDAGLHGIVDHDHAVKIALDILDPIGNLRESPYHTFDITACRV